MTKQNSTTETCKRTLNFDYRCTPEVRRKLFEVAEHAKAGGSSGIRSTADVLEYLIVNLDDLNITEYVSRPKGLGPFKGGRTVHNNMCMSPPVMELFRQRLVQVREKWPQVRTRADLLESWVLALWSRTFPEEKG